MELCRHLRWKGYDEAQAPDEVQRMALRNAVPFRCLRTCQPWGVDDDLAAPENCVRGRPCFTPKGAPSIDEDDDAPDGDTTAGEV